MSQRRRIVAPVLPLAALAVWGTVGVHVASATVPNDATQSAYAEKATFVPTECIIAEVGGIERVYRMPPLDAGNETVVDAIARINGLALTASRHRTWIERHDAKGGEATQVLPVDWKGITERGDARTNYLLHPGDVLYVK